MLAQERELAEKRLVDGRRRLAADVRQELLSGLERVRLEAVNRTAPAGAAEGPERGIIACAAYFLFQLVSSLQAALQQYGQALMEDIPNFTNIQPQLQIGDIIDISAV